MNNIETAKKFLLQEDGGYIAGDYTPNQVYQLMVDYCKHIEKEKNKCTCSKCTGLPDVESFYTQEYHIADIYKYKNHKNRGLTNNVYFYFKGYLNQEPIFVRCIICQNGDILISDDPVTFDKDGTVFTTVAEFLNEKFNFVDNSIVSINHSRYDNGIIREIDNEKRILEIEVENEETCEYNDITISFDDVMIVYPEFTYNDRRKYKKI